MQSLASIPEFEADPHEQTQRKQHLKCEKNCFQKQNKKNPGKVKSTHPTHLRFLGSAMNGNKNTNKKNDENQIKNANPNPNREKREKRAIENFYFFTKSCQHFFSNYTKLYLLKWETKNIQSPFFMGHYTVGSRKLTTCKNYIKQSA